MNPHAFFWCAHCKRVVKAPIDVLEAAEGCEHGQVMNFHCPRCHRYEVEYRLPSVRREKAPPQRADDATAAEWFARIRNVIL